MTKILITSLGVILFALSNLHAVMVTGFGTGEFTVTVSDFTDTQTATYLQISGSDFGSEIFGSFSSVAVPSNYTQLELTATKTAGTATSTFIVELYDAISGGNTLTYQGTWGAFTNNVPATVVLSQIAAAPGWNGTAHRLSLSTSGTGDSLTVQLDNLTAVPEPTTIALLGTVLAGGALMLRRRRTSSLS